MKEDTNDFLITRFAAPRDWRPSIIAIAAIAVVTPLHPERMISSDDKLRSTYFRRG